MMNIDQTLCQYILSRRLVSLQFFIIISYLTYTFPMSKFYVVFGIKAFRSHYFYSLSFTANFAFEPNLSHFLVLINLCKCVICGLHANNQFTYWHLFSH